MDARRAFGNEGEALAAAHLEKLGYKIVARQARTPFGEIDLVACDGEEVVFVEVKTRRNRHFGFPEESVTPTKLAHISASAQHFLRVQCWEARPCRIDIISLLLIPGEPANLEHLRGVDVSGVF